MNTVMNNALINTGKYTGKAVSLAVDTAQVVWHGAKHYAGVAIKALLAGVTYTAAFLGINKHTAIVGTVAAVVTGIGAHAAIGATVLGATAATAAWAGLVAIPLMALYVVMARFLGYKMSYRELIGASTVGMLIPYAAVYGGLLAAYAFAYASHLVTLAWFNVAVLFVL